MTLTPNELILILAAIASTITAVGGLWLGSKLQKAQTVKTQAETAGLDIATQQAVRSFYKDVIKDLTERLEVVEVEQVTLRDTHIALVQKLHVDISELRAANDTANINHASLVENLTTNISGLQTLVGEQRDTIEKLRLEIEKLHNFIAGLNKQIAEGADTPAAAVAVKVEETNPVSMVVESMTVKDMTVTRKPGAG